MIGFAPDKDIKGTGHGGGNLYFQHSMGRGRKIIMNLRLAWASEFQAANSRLTEWNSVSQKIWFSFS